MPLALSTARMSSVYCEVRSAGVESGGVGGNQESRMKNCGEILLLVGLMLWASVCGGTQIAGSDELFDPAWRGKTVTTEGVVHNVAPCEDGCVELDIYRNVAAFSVVLEDPSMVTVRDYEDALVRVTGRLEARLGADGVISGVVLRAPDISYVEVLTPPPEDPFKLPLADIYATRTQSDEGRLHRLHVKGVVIFSRSIDTSFMLHLDEGRNICVVPSATKVPLPAVGDIVEVCAFLASVSVTPRLVDALVRVVGHDDSAVPPPRALPIAEVVDLPRRIDAESLYGRTVVTEGRVREVNRRAKFMQIFLTDGEETLLALVPLDQSVPTPDGFLPSARLKVTGNISFYHRSGLLLSDSLDPQNLTLHLDGVHNVELIKRAPYWTAQRVWTLLAAVVLGLTAAGFGLAWLVRLRERTRAQAARRERLRLSHDLHDNLQQLLAATMFRLDAAQSFFEDNPTASKEQLGWAMKSVANTQAGLRTVLWDLQEESEGPESLSGLVRYAVSRFAHWQERVFVEVHGSEPAGARRLGGRFLMIIQEAVGNALKHGGATHVSVRIYFRPHLVRLMVVDNGCGFDISSVPDEAEGHIGLSSMRLRAQEAGGTFSVKSEVGHGTAVLVEVAQ